MMPSEGDGQVVRELCSRQLKNAVLLVRCVEDEAGNGADDAVDDAVGMATVVNAPLSNAYIAVVTGIAVIVHASRIPTSPSQNSRFCDAHRRS